MTDGPVEILMVGFPDDRLRPKLVSALVDLVETETIRLLDVVVAAKDDEGSVRVLEIDDLDADARELFYDLDGEYGGLVGEQDVLLAAERLPAGTSAVLLVWENRWAARFAAAVRDSGGGLIMHERVPRDAAAEALAALERDCA